MNVNYLFLEYTSSLRLERIARVQRESHHAYLRSCLTGVEVHADVHDCDGRQASIRSVAYVPVYTVSVEYGRSGDSQEVSVHLSRRGCASPS